MLAPLKFANKGAYSSGHCQKDGSANNGHLFFIMLHIIIPAIVVPDCWLIINRFCRELQAVDGTNACNYLQENKEQMGRLAVCSLPFTVTVTSWFMIGQRGLF